MHKSKKPAAKPPKRKPMGSQIVVRLPPDLAAFVEEARRFYKKRLRESVSTSDVVRTAIAEFARFYKDDRAVEAMTGLEFK